MASGIVQGITGRPDVPVRLDANQFRGRPTGFINRGDWVAFSGLHVRAAREGTPGYWRASGAGIALQPNPTIDRYGNTITADSIIIQAGGQFMVSAAFSGVPAYGTPVYPASTGSAVGYPTGMTGVGATWQTAVGVQNNANNVPSGVGRVIGHGSNSNAGTGELLIVVSPLTPDGR